MQIRLLLRLIGSRINRFATPSGAFSQIMSMSAKARLLLLAWMAATAVVVWLAILAVTGRTSATPSEAPTVAVNTEPAPNTPWGDPDLQGIWSRDVDIPLERPVKYANQEFFRTRNALSSIGRFPTLSAEKVTKAAGLGAPSET